MTKALGHDERASHENATDNGHGGHGNHEDHSGNGAHGGHAHHVAQFRRLFWINLIIAIPVVGFSPMFASLIGYSVPEWAPWVAAVFGTVMYLWGGKPFLTGG